MLFIYNQGWAIKRGFLTAKAGRPDTYRAANNLLRMALDGKICLSLRPPGFTVNKSMLFFIIVFICCFRIHKY